KTSAQNNFKYNRLPLLVATKAFGMGIDKPNVRYTVHYNIPPSLESFYQEAGRAGRDQQNAYCWLIFSDDNAASADEALEPNIEISRLQEIVSDYNRGDVHRLLWLHQNSFRGIDVEM